jgi:hypothetical protein
MRLWGLTEIGEYYAVNRQRAKAWSRHSAFPSPFETLAQGSVWLPGQVIAWGEAHGRTKGCGPLPAKRPAKR